eukprot:TRINITY_DN6536_c2_g3_i1.p1 TRINITY_DN6536_c2_g3~~TRINITY_DN6536_c2_g3_i1.p1  ORF type:complete len:279 (+),score=21.33 TRINITY_DN6536_c2_g3_i1:106-942(+)
MGCGASSEPVVATVVEKIVDEEKPTRLRRWVCHKCTLRNAETASVCGACRSVPPTEGTAWLDDSQDDEVMREMSDVSSGGDSFGYWQQFGEGEPAEAYIDGVWVDCTVRNSSKLKVEVLIDDLVWIRDPCDVKRHKLADCCICLEPLCNKSLGAFVNENGTRACAHYAHRRCAAALPSQSCPICRTSFAHIVQVPRPDQHFHEWFNVTDVTKKGKLSVQELTNSITSMTPFSEEEVSSKIRTRWPHANFPIQVEAVVPIVSFFFIWAGRQKCVSMPSA